jgi:DNA helicase II / ATP-dependent DNA helicase PcrA
VPFGIPWEQLNAEQRQAVEAWDECLLVMAPVGTGKTSALAWRAANAIGHGVPARSVLCLSFTNKASRQMRERAAAVLGEDASKITARTFHSLCAMILRGDAGALGLDGDFLIFDDEDARSTACEIAVRMGVTAERRERLGFFLSNALQEIRLAAFGNLAGGNHAGRGQEDLFQDIRDKNAPPGLRIPSTFRFAALHAEYVHALRESHALDFADLVIGVNRLWQEAGPSLRRWQERFQWIQVDEVQDTNVSEYRILRAIASSHRRLSFFGDVDQTIYEWRGSAPGEILASYRKEFAPVQEILFTQNYRSTRAILRACSSVVHALEGAVTEEIIPRSLEEGAPVVLKACATLKEEAEWIAATLKDLRKSDEIRYSDCAVLVRTNFNARDLSEQFQRLKVPHLPVENVKFFERMEVKDAMAHLRLLLNLNDVQSILRFLERPSKGVGPATLKELRGAPRDAGLNLGDLLRTTTYEWGEPYAPLLDAWAKGRLVVFDFETTGLDPSLDEICEIAATRRGPEGSHEGETHFHAYIRTERPVGESSQIHGYTDEFLAANGRPASVVIPEFLEFLGPSVLTGHNINGFDVYFLRAALKKLGLDQVQPLCFDTLEIARRLFRTLRRYSLGALSTQFGISLDHAHEAHADVEANAALIDVLCKRLAETAAARQDAVRSNAARFEPLARKVARWSERMAEERPDELLTRILDESGLAEYYQEDPNERRRLEYLKQLVAFCHELDDPLLPPEMAYREVVENVTLATDFDRQANREDKLAILTVHQAKGLEYPVVFVSMATDDNFPSSRSKREGRLSEEHRLFYVAISRAKRRLYLSWYERDSRGNRTIPSRYIAYMRKTLTP